MDDKKAKSWQCNKILILDIFKIITKKDKLQELD